MFPSDLHFSKAIIDARRPGRVQSDARRVYRLPADRPSARPLGRGR